MWAWDIVSTTHDILAHTGFMLPHGEVDYSDNGELRWANEIDQGLVSLGSSLDGSFAQALADAVDPFGNLDQDPALLIPQNNPRTEFYPYLPCRPHQLPDGTSYGQNQSVSVNEFHRPWAYPSQSAITNTQTYATPTEFSNIRAELDFAQLDGDLSNILHAGVQVQAGTVSGPYPQGATPDEVFFRTGRPVQATQRQQYEQAPTPAHTDALNETLIGRSPETDHSPLGDPIQLCAYLMGQVCSPEYIYETDFNLDADRGYGYRCWDWIRQSATGTDQRGQSYPLPVVPPEGCDTSFPKNPLDEQWSGARPDSTQTPIQLRYILGRVAH
jgi:hypothetical protein